MTQKLELSDIQGNIVRAYGKSNYPKARYFFLHIENADAGRKFVEAVRHKITTAARWDKSPEMEGKPGGMPRVTLNIAFTFYGLLALQLPPHPPGHAPRVHRRYEGPGLHSGRRRPGSF